MVDTVELNSYGQKFRRFGKGGENVVVTMTKYDDKRGTSSAVELGSIRLDMEDRKTKKPDKIIASIRKAMSGEYEKQGCNMLGFTHDGKKCTDKPLKKTGRTRPSQAPAPQTPKRRELRTAIAKRK